MGGGGEGANSYELCREYYNIKKLFFKFVTFVVSFNPQVMGWGGGGGNYDELWTEIFNIPVILGIIIVLFLFSEKNLSSKIVNLLLFSTL